jgi:hypothetical protein
MDHQVPVPVVPVPVRVRGRMGLLLIAACCAGVVTAGPVAAQEQDPPASGQVTPVVVEPPTDEERQALADCLADPACAPYVPSSAETGFTVREVGAAEEPALDAAFDAGASRREAPPLHERDRRMDRRFRQDHQRDARA